MAQKNGNLHAAKSAKNDEFYTQLTDIEKEMKHYKKYFEGKVVFCNCDDPTWSEFWRYFHLNFTELKLKKLISTHYDAKERTYKLEYTGGDDGDVEVGTRTDLLQNGDFRSDESIALLKEADIIVTNPPFSLFRVYLAQLIEYKKDFIILGNQNAVTYKEVFPLIKANKVWYGASIHSGGLDFRIPDDYEEYSKNVFIRDGHHYINLSGIRWFTNLDYPQRHEDLVLWKNYDPMEYPKYDNYDAINVDKTAQIPCDYCESWGVTMDEFNKMQQNEWEVVRQSIEHDGSTTVWIIPAQGTELRKMLSEQTDRYRQTIESVINSAIYCNGQMGVPITYLDKHNDNQFCICGADFDLANKMDLGNGKFGTGRFYADLEQSTAEHSRAQQSTAEHSRAQQSTAEHSRAKRLYSRIVIKKKL